MFEVLKNLNRKNDTDDTKTIKYRILHIVGLVFLASLLRTTYRHIIIYSVFKMKIELYRSFDRCL